MPVAFSVESNHCVVPADESDSQCTATQHVTYLFVWVQCAAAFPYIISHHKGELACKGCTLILITFVKLVGH